MVGKLVIRHTSWIEGGERYARKLQSLPGVGKVRPGRLGHFKRGKVSTRVRSPEVSSLDSGVRVRFFTAHGWQDLFVFPSKGTTLHQLADRVRHVLDDEDRRSGVGVSSNAPIEIPDHIRRRMAMAVQPAPAAPAPLPAALVQVAANDQPITSVPDKRILRWHEEAYQKLLTLDTTGRATRFSVGELRAALRKVGYDDIHEVHAIEQALKKVGFVAVGDEPSGMHARGRVAYVYRVTGYHVVDGRMSRRALPANPRVATSDVGEPDLAPATESPRRTRSARLGELDIVGALTRFMEDLEPSARRDEKISFTVDVRKGKVAGNVRIASGDTHNIVHKVR